MGFPISQWKSALPGSNMVNGSATGFTSANLVQFAFAGNFWALAAAKRATIVANCFMVSWYGRVSPRSNGARLVSTEFREKCSSRHSLYMCLKSRSITSLYTVKHAPIYESDLKYFQKYVQY